jgi:dipeptidyl aminopeptidase/acylaminoacyl peptidase
MPNRRLLEFMAVAASLAGACALTLTAIAAAAGAPADKRRPLRLDDFYLMDSVSDPQLSPDGRWIAYLVTTSDRASDTIQSAVWMVSWDGTQQVRLTQPASGISSPRWSPDGRYLSYLGKPAADGHTQVMALDRRGGEPHALTHANDDVSNYAWSPDGKRLVLMIETDSDVPRDPEAAKKPRPIVIDDLFFKEDVTGYIGRGLKQQLFLCDVDGGRPERLAGEDPKSNDFLPAWSPDGKQVAFARTHERGEDRDGMMDIDVIDARAGATPRRLVRVYAPNFQRIAFSPDGKLVAFLQGLEPKYYIYLHDELAAVPAAGGTPRALTGKLDRWIYDYDFAADSQSIYMVVEDDRVQYPARLSLANLAIEKLVQRPLVVTAMTVGGGKTALVAADDATAAEVYAFENGSMRRLTHHGDRLLNEVELGASEEFDFRSKDGTEIHGMLVKPPGYVAGRRYPTILWIHGGPDLQDTHSIDFDGYQMLRQLIAADGYVVIGVNYRGSSGRGFEFARAIYADWGHKEVEDLLAAADAAVERGIADPERLGIGGWSYGGMLTDYTIASDTRFRAAMAGAGAGNALAMYGVDQYVLWYNTELGPPWHDPAPWLKVSYPLFHADRIRTPTLFMGGDADFNVPIAGGEQMYVALRTLGVPTELVVYPDQHHEIAVPSLYKDRWVRTLGWFDRYLKPAH